MDLLSFQVLSPSTPVGNQLLLSQISTIAEPNFRLVTVKEILKN